MSLERSLNFDAYLEEARAQGRADSLGHFSLSLPEFLDRLSHRVLVSPDHAPLAVVAAAVGASAKSMEIVSAKRALIFTLELEFEVGASANWDSLLQIGAARQLLLAALVWRTLASRVELTLPGQERRLVITPGEIQWEPSARTEAATLVVSRKTARANNLQAHLLRYCSLCPVPLSLNGQSIQRPLSTTGRCAWSSSIPENLRPGFGGELQTDLAVFMTETLLREPVWVAVVGGLSYPFLLPEAQRLEGIVWSSELRADLGLAGLVTDSSWTSVREELIRQCRRTELGKPLEKGSLGIRLD